MAYTPGDIAFAAFQRMSVVFKEIELLIYLADRAFQQAYSVQHPWSQPIHIPGKTHFLTLESPAEVAASITPFCGA